MFPDKEKIASSPVVNGRFADEDDLYTEVDAARSKNSEGSERGSAQQLVHPHKRHNVSDEEEDAGVCLASVSSSSPASSRELNGRRCRSVCVGDIKAFQCENQLEDTTRLSKPANCPAPVAESTPEAKRKQNGGSCNVLMNSNCASDMPSQGLSLIHI